MRQMRQPRKDVLREQLAAAAAEIIRLREELEAAKRNSEGWRRMVGWWRR